MGVSLILTAGCIALRVAYIFAVVYCLWEFHYILTEAYIALGVANILIDRGVLPLGSAHILTRCVLQWELH